MNSSEADNDSDAVSSSDGSNSRSRKGAPFLYPASASQSFAYIPPDQLRANRMVVPGREQDFGPLPPNYHQATEAYEVR